MAKIFKKLTTDVATSTPESLFNIAYGDTEPTDTSKLWIKTSKPEAVQVVSEAVLETDISSLPSGRYGIAAAAVATKVYLFGGYYINGASVNTIHMFNTETYTMTSVNTVLPTAANGIAAAAVGTKVYLFGGSGHLNTINVFDTETNTITTLSTTLPTGAFDIASAVVGTKVYLFGGRQSTSGYGVYLDTINVFDTETNTITTLSTTLPIAAMSYAAAAVGTKVYLFGGYDGSGINTINVFDTETNTITTLSTTLPIAAYDIAAAAVGTKVYLFGGSRMGSGINTINVFDTETNAITASSMTLPIAAYNIASAVVGTKVYLFGGYRGSNFSYGAYLNTVHAFTGLMVLPPNNILLDASINKNLFNLLPNVKLGVNAVYLGNADGYGEKVAAALYVNGAWVEI